VETNSVTLSASGIIERNFIALKILPPFPILSCKYKTGHPSSRRMANEINNQRGADRIIPN